jgi:hypothetical protein
LALSSVASPKTSANDLLCADIAKIKRGKLAVGPIGIDQALPVPPFRTDGSAKSPRHDGRYRSTKRCVRAAPRRRLLGAAVEQHAEAARAAIPHCLWVTSPVGDSHVPDVKLLVERADDKLTTVEDWNLRVAISS